MSAIDQHDRGPDSAAEKIALIALLRDSTDDMKWNEITDRVLDRGSAVALWEELHPQGLFDNSDTDDRLTRARDDITRWTSARYRLHTLFDPSYPAQVRSVRQMPPFLFTEGELRPDERAVSVVGSRAASERGLDFARRVAETLVEYDIAVVAGLAEGIDSTAHRAALDAGGRTVAVLGNGLDRVYPKSNTELQATIARRGMLLSQFTPEFAPTKWTFPARNAVMSAYGIATVVAEAGEHSGTRIQAREAVAHGRAVILSETVALSTTWGSRLVDQPGVFVASDPAEAIACVERIVANEDEVARLVSASFE